MQLTDPVPNCLRTLAALPSTHPSLPTQGLDGLQPVEAPAELLISAAACLSEGLELIATLRSELEQAAEANINLMKPSAWAHREMKYKQVGRMGQKRDVRGTCPTILTLLTSSIAAGLVGGSVHHQAAAGDHVVHAVGAGRAAQWHPGAGAQGEGQGETRMAWSGKKHGIEVLGGVVAQQLP